MSGSRREGRVQLAIELMEEALRLLREEAAGAVPLREAIESARSELPVKTKDPAAATVAHPPFDAAAVRAVGGVLGILASFLERGGMTTIEEVGNMLGIYAAVAAETSPDEAMVLSCWAGMVGQLAQRTNRHAAH